MTRLAILSMAALSLFWAMPAYAVVYFDHGFDTPADDTNTADNVPNAGYSIYRGPVATAPYSFSGPSDNPSNANSNTTLGGRGSIIFAPAANTGFSDNSVGLFTHPYVYGGGADAGTVTHVSPPGQNNPLDNTTTGKFVFSFDLALNKIVGEYLDTSDWTNRPYVLLNANYFANPEANSGYRPALRFTNDDGAIYLISSNGPAANLQENVTTVETLVAAAKPDALDAFHVEALIDMDTNTFTISVDGVAVPGVYNLMIPNIDTIGYFGSALGIGGYSLYGGAPNTTAFEGFYQYYDNISFATAPVPEPASLGALGGLIAMLVRRRRRE